MGNLATLPMPVQQFHLVHPEHYASFGYPYAEWARLRREDPVHWFDRTAGLPFWAITRHADIQIIAKRPHLFASGPRMVMSHVPDDPFNVPPTLNRLDPPVHGMYRQLVSTRFTRRWLEGQRADISRICRQFVVAVLEKAGTPCCDVVPELAAPLANGVVAWILGVPEEDWGLLLRLIDRSIGVAEPHLQHPDVHPTESFAKVIGELFLYFTTLLERRRREPGEDFISLLGTLELDGKPVSDDELFRYFFLMIWAAANEAVRSAVAGAVLSFAEWPTELGKLRRQPKLVPLAVEEVLRWVSPIIHFARTSRVEFELRGKLIRPGDSIALFFPSANRDEEVFPDGERFRIDRNPNDHLSFGVGEHFCLGSQVARLVLRATFAELLPRISNLEVAGQVARIRSNWSGGFSSVPVRFD